MAKGDFIDISMLGDARLARQLKAIPLVMQRKVVRKSLREGANVVLAEARNLVPVETGRLRQSLRIRATKRRRGRTGVRIMTAPRKFFGIADDSRWYYPAHVEYGYRRKDGTVVPPRSYLRAALANKQTAALRIVRRRIDEGVREAARSTR